MIRSQKRRNGRRSQLSVFALAGINAVSLGAALCMFALFHHVLPQKLGGPLMERHTPTPAPVTAETPDPFATPTPTPHPEATPTAEPTPTPRVDGYGEFYVKYADKFTDEPVATETSYTDPHVAVTVSKVAEGSGDRRVTYYVADIYVGSMEYFRTYLADNTYGKGLRAKLLAMDEETNAILALTGDYYGNHTKGVVIRNGVLYRAEKSSMDICVLYYDGTMATMERTRFDAEAAMAAGAWQAWTFGPGLLDEDGSPMASFNTTDKLKERHPRSALGYYEPGHYCFVVVDGRDTGYSRGMDLIDLSYLFYTLGCKAAYNLDGGQSAMMSFDDALVNQPYDGGRMISDCLYIGEALG